MIASALQIMLFGMLGIFIVMGLIFGSIRLLNSFQSGEEKGE